MNNKFIVYSPWEILAMIPKEKIPEKVLKNGFIGYFEYEDEDEDEPFEIYKPGEALFK